jgi:hypothetical protein
MLPKVYIEMTIVSYLTGRPSRELVAQAHRTITQEWWETRRSSFELYASVIRIVEKVCRGYGFEPPVICTPEELMELT